MRQRYRLTVYMGIPGHQGWLADNRRTGYKSNGFKSDGFYETASA